MVVMGRDEQRLDETTDQLQKGVEHMSVCCDLTHIETELDSLVPRLPVLQGVVLNAGIDKKVPVRYLKLDDLNQLLETNTTAPIMLLKLLLRHRRLDRNASVVFISSVAALGAAAVGNAAYAASKGAISSFVSVAALELAPKGIRVNAVCPGMVRTPMTEALLSDGQDAEKIEHYPLKRLGEPTDVAWAAMYLLSDAASWVTGTNLVVDGGLTLA